MNKKTAKGKKRAGAGALKPKTLSARQARSVKGGKARPVLIQTCATGTHLKEATITH
ncbi:MAG: hypothetical protein ABI592_06010 [Acidobacteriota bacterium]